MRKKFNLIISILNLLLFVSAHFLIGMYNNVKFFYYLFWADFFLYLAIGLHIFLIVSITFTKTKRRIPKQFFDDDFEALILEAKWFVVKKEVIK